VAVAEPPAQPPVDADVDEADEFDYLAYAQDRAMFFWADLLALNLVREDELPRQMVEHIRSRMIEY
jgi:choline kinase